MLKHANSYNKAKIKVIKELDNLEIIETNFIQKTFPNHLHEGYSFAVIEKGLSRLHCNGATHDASPNCVTILHPEEVHSAEVNIENGLIYRTISPSAKTFDFCKQALGINGDTTYFDKRVIWDKKFARFFVDTHNKIMQSTELIKIESLVYGLLCHLIEKYSLKQVLDTKHVQHDFNKVKNYIREYYHEPLSLKILAQEANLSPSHFISLFKQQFEISPYAYLVNVRLHMAKENIRSGKSISQTALDTGFTDQSHLNKYFKANFGTTPGNYKNAIKS